MIQFNCDLESRTMPMPHYWEHCVGSGHATLALRADWQRQLKRCRDELGFRYVRFHGILSDDMGTLVNQNDALLYSFFNADQIFDFLLSIGMKPFVELGFMPRALASGNKTVFHYQGNVTPPRDYKQWADFIEKIVRHWVERYGIEEVRTWFFEVWNEPNQPQFWTGKKEGYFKLYKYTVEAIKRVDESLQVGGPATSKNAWVEDFLKFCRKNKLPADFVSTHHYPTDAFGEVSTDTVEQLAAGRRSMLREEMQNVFARAKGLPIYYTEWNASSNPRDELHDESYAAAFITKTVLEASGLVENYSFWTFSDIFEENYFPSVPFHGGFGLQNIHGIPKPTYRAYELLHELGTEKLLVDGIHHTVDAWVVKKENSATVLLTNHALPKSRIETEPARIKLTNAPNCSAAYITRIDDTRANAKKVWTEMGKPDYLSHAQVERLEEASRLIREPLSCEFQDSTINFEIDMPPHSVAAITVEF